MNINTYSFTRMEKGPLKRSEVNLFIDRAIKFFSENRYPLPEHAYWSPGEWHNKGPEFDEIRDLGLGWDVTDFGCGEFLNTGRIIFTLRNGSSLDKRYPKPYAQKIMCLLERQMSPVHCHRIKMEDIINHRGGNIILTFWESGPDGLSDGQLDISLSGVRTRISSGEQIRLQPGESVTIPPSIYHQFWAEENQGPVLSMEISTICDDYGDNVFLDAEGLKRFPEIIEDEPPRYLLGNEYRSAPDKKK